MRGEEVEEDDCYGECGDCVLRIAYCVSVIERSKIRNTKYAIRKQPTNRRKPTQFHQPNTLVSPKHPAIGESHARQIAAVHNALGQGEEGDGEEVARQDDGQKRDTCNNE